jgi:hypothetical protein
MRRNYPWSLPNQLAAWKFDGHLGIGTPVAFADWIPSKLASPRMPVRTSVSYFTLDQGKLRGVATRVRKPNGTIGSGLEPLSHATVCHYRNENRELVKLNSRRRRFEGVISRLAD